MSIERLTRRAASKYAAIGDARDEASSRVAMTLRRIKELEVAAEEGRGDPEELARLHDKRTREQVAIADLSRVTSSLRDWLQRLPRGMVLRDVNRSARRRARGESSSEAVARLREEIDGLAKERASAAMSVLPMEDVRAMVERHVASLAAEMRPSISAGPNADIRYNDGGRPTALAVAAWLDPEAVVLRLMRHAEARRLLDAQSGARVMSREERDAEISRLDAAILGLERDEESLIVEAELESTHIARRANASPAAILGVRLERPAPEPPPQAPTPVSVADAPDSEQSAEARALVR
jgi:hypothetical protein